MDSLVFKFNNGKEIKDLSEADRYVIDIILNDKVIGNMIFFYDLESFQLESWGIDEEYRGFGYGTIVMEMLKRIGMHKRVKYIRGECPSRRIEFYKRLGAIFECRTEEDKDFINNVFYIDL